MLSGGVGVWWGGATNDVTTCSDQVLSYSHSQ